MTLAFDLEPHSRLAALSRALREKAISQRLALRELTKNCRNEVARSSELRNQAMFLGLDCIERHKTYRFYMSAIVGCQPVLAMWPTIRLVASPALLERAHVVVALGEEFQVDEGRYSVLAGLDEPLAAALTLLRACDQVIEFHVLFDLFDEEVEINLASRISATDLFDGPGRKH